MNGKELIKALNTIVEEKNISADIIFEALELALQTAYKKNFNSKTNVRVNINRETGDIKVYSYYVVVPEIDEGKVVGIGTHNELMKNCEVYKQIALSQLSKEELDNE